MFGAVRRWWLRRITAELEEIAGSVDMVGSFLWMGPSLAHYRCSIYSPWGTSQKCTNVPVETESVEKFDIILWGDVLDRISNVRLKHLVASTEGLLGDTGRVLLVAPLSSWVSLLVGRQEEFTVTRVSQILGDHGFEVEEEHWRCGALIRSYRRDPQG